MKITLKKLTAQEMVEQGIDSYIYISPDIMYASILLFLFLGAVLINNNQQEIYSMACEVIK